MRDVIQIAPGVVATIDPGPPAVLVPLAEIRALRRTVGELVQLLEAATPGSPADVEPVRAFQGLARAVARRLENLT